MTLQQLLDQILKIQAETPTAMNCQIFRLNEDHSRAEEIEPSLAVVTPENDMHAWFVDNEYVEEGEDFILI